MEEAPLKEEVIMPEIVQRKKKKEEDRIKKEADRQNSEEIREENESLVVPVDEEIKIEPVVESGEKQEEKIIEGLPLDDVEIVEDKNVLTAEQRFKIYQELEGKVNAEGVLEITNDQFGFYDLEIIIIFLLLTTSMSLLLKFDYSDLRRAIR